MKYPAIVSDVRGWGLISGIEIAADSSLMAADFAKALMEDGVLVVPAGPKVIRFVRIVKEYKQIYICICYYYYK